MASHRFSAFISARLSPHRKWRESYFSFPNQFRIFFRGKVYTGFSSIAPNVAGNAVPRLKDGPPPPPSYEEEGSVRSVRNPRRRSLRAGRISPLENAAHRVVKVLARCVLVVYI